MPWHSQSVLLFAALCAEWWIPFGLCMRAERRRAKRRVFIAYWQRYFNENVAGKWIFNDGVGH